MSREPKHSNGTFSNSKFSKLKNTRKEGQMLRWFSESRDNVSSFISHKCVYLKLIDS